MNFKALLHSLSVGILCIFMLSCNTECGSPPPVPLISFDSPVYEGDYLVLEARGSDNHTYTWQDPLDDVSTGRYYEVGTVQRVNAGDYIVTVDDGICDGITNYQYVDVLPIPIPCFPNAHSGSFVNAPVEYLNDPKVDYAYDSLGHFLIVVEGSGATVTIEFLNDEILYYDRSYGIKGKPNYSARDLVEIKVEFNSSSSVYEANADGLLYIQAQSGNSFNFFLCDLPLFSESETIFLSLNLTLITE